MSTTSPTYDQLRRGTLRNRALAWFADHSYRSAAGKGAAFAIAIDVVAYLMRQLDALMPGPDIEPPVSLRWFLVNAALTVLTLALLMCLVTAVARGVLRLYVRARTGAGLS